MLPEDAVLEAAVDEAETEAGEPAGAEDESAVDEAAVAAAAAAAAAESEAEAAVGVEVKSEAGDAAVDVPSRTVEPRPEPSSAATSGLVLLLGLFVFGTVVWLISAVTADRREDEAEL